MNKAQLKIMRVVSGDSAECRMMAGSTEPLPTPEALLLCLPECEAREELFRLVSLGRKFQQQQHAGRRPGFLARFLLDLMRQAGAPLAFEKNTGNT